MESAHLDQRCDDIATVPDDVFPRADVVVGGPPCQGFSNLGTRNPDDPRNLLWREYARVVRLTRPAVFVLENVPQFLKSDQYGLLVDWTQDGPLRGYELTAGVLNAADYGVVQRRRRAIVAVTAEPLPSRLAAIARGTGELDCVYHIALQQLRTACQDNTSASDTLEELIEQDRLRPW